MSFHVCGSSGSFAVAGKELSISDSVTHVDQDSAHFFGSVGGVVAAGHFSKNSITSRYGSNALSLLINWPPVVSAPSLSS
eukprot:SAG11_NODE_5922_length_1432_cov_1.568642_2_plen_80_part_00